MLFRGLDKQFKNVLEFWNRISLSVQIASKCKFGQVENLATFWIDHSYMECVLPADFHQPGSVLRLFRFLPGASGVNSLANPFVLWVPGLRIPLHVSLRPLKSRQVCNFSTNNWAQLLSEH